MIKIANKKRKKKLKRKYKNTLNIFLSVIGIIIIGTLGLNGFNYYMMASKELKPVDEEKEYYNLSDFGFIQIKSETDYDNDGIDDYTDILNGEKKEAKINPKYVSKYYAGGYPPDGEGVCTDIVWKALQEAGYSLKDMMAQDIRDEAKKDTYGIEIIDDNIDFRRVGNQEIFFQRYALTLDTDFYEVGSFQPGDIVTFDYSSHIAMVSDKYNKNGIPYLIQNRDETQKEKEEDRLEITDMQVTGHYRFEYNDNLQKLINKINSN